MYNSIPKLWEREGNGKRPFPNFGNGKGTKKSIPKFREHGGNEKKGIPEIRDGKGEKKKPFPKSVTGGE